MLESKRLESRNSEIRQQVAELSGKADMTDDEQRSLDAMTREYSQNESKHRAALIAEDEERREAGEELETRSGNEWADLVGQYELRQVALNLDEGAALTGQTAEVVEEMRSAGGYRGVPVPLEALEQRAGETTSGNIPDPVSTKNIIDRLFPGSVASGMGANMVNVGSGSNEYPVVTDGTTTGWAGSEAGNVAGPSQFKTAPFSLKPDHTLGAQMQITRKSMKQSANIEGAIRRDMRSAIGVELDRAIFQGSGASGEPSGVISKASGYGITETDVSAAADYSMFITAVSKFMQDNTATGPGSVRALIRPEIWAYADGQMFDAGSGITMFDKIASKLGSIVMSHNVLAAPANNKSKVLLTTTAGIAPIYVGRWGGLDLIRDVYSKAASGQLLITALLTTDVTVSRAEQLRVLKNVQSA